VGVGGSGVCASVLYLLCFLTLRASPTLLEEQVIGPHCGLESSAVEPDQGVASAVDYEGDSFSP
jgi:hypothetical protein